jgi:AbrB family looped-hinge helix DNA binding protein
MVTATARVSSKHQIVLPKEVRAELGVKAGDDLLFIIRDGEIVVRSRPASFAQAMRGLHKNVWNETDVEQWLAAERKSWE